MLAVNFRGILSISQETSYACCIKIGTAEAENLYAALAIKKRSVNHIFHAPTHYVKCKPPGSGKWDTICAIADSKVLKPPMRILLL